MLQRYVSPELTHFVGRTFDQPRQYELLKQILASGWLMHPPYNPNYSGNLRVNVEASLCRNEMYVPEIVCFCDIPVEDLRIHMQKYSQFGIAFRKSFLIAKGANPVFYLARNATIQKLKSDIALADVVKGTPGDSPGVSRCDHFDASVRDHNTLMDQLSEAILNSPGVVGVPPEYRALTEARRFIDFHVISFFKFFDDALTDNDPDNYYMEREWRVVGNVNFTLKDVERVILPRAFAARFRSEMPHYAGQLSFAE